MKEKVYYIWVLPAHIFWKDVRYYARFTYDAVRDYPWPWRF